MASDAEFLKTLVATSFFRGFSVLGTVVLNFVLGRTLGAEGVGLFMLSFSVITGLGVLARFGMDSALLRFAGIAYGKNDGPVYIGLRRQALALSLSLSFLFALVLFVGRHYIAAKFFGKPGLANVFLIMSFVLPFYTSIYLMGTFLKSMSRPAIAPLFEPGSAAFFTSLIVVACVWLGGSSSITLVSWSFLFATICLLAVGQFVMFRIERKRFGKIASFSYSKDFVSSLPDFAIIAIAFYVAQWGALLVLGLFVSSVEVGLFSVSLRMAFVINFVFVVFNSILAPRFASLASDGRLSDLESIAVKSTVYMTIMASPVLLIFLFFSDNLLRLFGEEFVAASPYLICLALAQFVNVATGSVSALLNMTGSERCMRNVLIFSGLLCLVLSLILCPFFGIWGATIATALSVSVQNILACIFVRKKLGIMTLPGWNMLRFGIDKCLSRF